MKNLKRKLKNKALFLMLLTLVACGKKEPTVYNDPLPERPRIVYAEFSNSWFVDFEMVDYTANEWYIIPEMIDQFSEVLTYDLEVYIDDQLVCTYARAFGTDYYQQKTKCPFLLKGQRIRIGNLSYQSIVYMMLSAINPDLIP